jgi:hypothetical protein
MKYAFTTKLPLHECIEQIEKHAEKDSPFSLFINSIKDDKHGMIYYRFRKHKVRLQTHLDMNNAFRPYFYGSLHKDGDGTKIEGEFKMHPFVRFFTYFWLAIYVYSGGLLFIRSLIELIKPGTIAGYTDNPFLGITLPVVFLAMFYAVIKFGKKSGEKNKKHILDFLHTTVKAK